MIDADDIHPIVSDEVAYIEAAIAREQTLTDDEEIARSTDLDELFEADVQASLAEADDEHIRMMYDDEDTIESLGLAGCFGP